MTLINRKGNIRGREFLTDIGIDGNACEETTKDQRWVGLHHQIPDPDTRPTFSLSSLSLSLLPSHSHSNINSSHLPSSTFIHSSVRSTQPYIYDTYSPPQIHWPPRRSAARQISTMGIRSGVVPRENDRDSGQRSTTISLTHNPLSYDSRYFDKHQTHPYQVNNNNNILFVI